MTASAALALDWHDLDAEYDEPGRLYGARVPSRVAGGAHHVALLDGALSVSPAPLTDDHATPSELRAYAAELDALAEVLAGASPAAIIEAATARAA